MLGFVKPEKPQKAMCDKCLMLGYETKYDYLKMYIVGYLLLHLNNN